MAEYKKYRRSGVTEMVPWTPDSDMAGVSVSDADRADGCPRPGDYIARNPDNHADRWLVNAAFFAKQKFVEVTGEGMSEEEIRVQVFGGESASFVAPVETLDEAERRELVFGAK